MRLVVHGGKVQRTQAQPTKAERLANAEQAAAAAHHRLGALEQRLALLELQGATLLNAILCCGAVPRAVLEEHAARVGLEFRTAGEHPAEGDSAPDESPEPKVDA